jgi:hypothetical protein
MRVTDDCSKANGTGGGFIPRTQAIAWNSASTGINRCAPLFTR